MISLNRNRYEQLLSRRITALSCTGSGLFWPHQRDAQCPAVSKWNIHKPEKYHLKLVFRVVPPAAVDNITSTASNAYPLAGGAM